MVSIQIDYACVVVFVCARFFQPQFFPKFKKAPISTIQNGLNTLYLSTSPVGHTHILVNKYEWLIDPWCPSSRAGFPLPWNYILLLGYASLFGLSVWYFWGGMMMMMMIMIVIIFLFNKLIWTSHRFANNRLIIFNQFSFFFDKLTTKAFIF